MDVADISGLFAELSVDNLLNGDINIIMSVIYLIVLIAIYSIVIWHFYRYIAKRDCFKIKTEKHKEAVSFLKYFLMYPIVAFGFFIGFSLMMFFITRNLEISSVLSTSFAVVTAIRITAYYSEDLSRDVAKMLPFALLGLFLVDPSYFSFVDIVNKINLLPEFFVLCVKFIISIVLVEWFLRIMLNVKRFITTKKLIVNKGRTEVTLY